MPPAEHAARVRPVRPVRSVYVVRSGPELFIVPLLKERVERAIAEHGPAGGKRPAMDVGCGPSAVSARAGGRRLHVPRDGRRCPPPPDFVQPIDEPLGAALRRSDRALYR